MSEIQPNTYSSPALDAGLVHEARKTIKRLRALSRLLRYELGEEEFARLDAFLRSTGQRLAGARDTEVVVATLDELIRRHPHAGTRVGVARLRRRLLAERAQAAERTLDETVLSDLRAARTAVSQLELADCSFEAVEPGLRRIYTEGRRRLRRIEGKHQADADALHAWRKRIKDLRYVAEMLSGADSEPVRRLERRADRLGELLGEEHDLALLAERVHEHAKLLEGDRATRELLLGLIARRRKRLRRRALQRGARLYRRKPDKFIRSMRYAQAR